MYQFLNSTEVWKTSFACKILSKIETIGKCANFNIWRDASRSIYRDKTDQCISELYEQCSLNTDDQLKHVMEFVSFRNKRENVTEPPFKDKQRSFSFLKKKNDLISNHSVHLFIFLQFLSQRKIKWSLRWNKWRIYSEVRRVRTTGSIENWINSSEILESQKLSLGC